MKKLLHVLSVSSLLLVVGCSSDGTPQPTDNAKPVLAQPGQSEEERDAGKVLEDLKKQAELEKNKDRIEINSKHAKQIVLEDGQKAYSYALTNTTGKEMKNIQVELHVGNLYKTYQYSLFKEKSNLKAGETWDIVVEPTELQIAEQDSSKQKNIVSVYQARYHTDKGVVTSTNPSPLFGVKDESARDTATNLLKERFESVGISGEKAEQMKDMGIFNKEWGIYDLNGVQYFYWKLWNQNSIDFKEVKFYFDYFNQNNEYQYTVVIEKDKWMSGEKWDLKAPMYGDGFEMLPSIITFHDGKEAFIYTDVEVKAERVIKEALKQ